MREDSGIVRVDADKLVFDELLWIWHAANPVLLLWLGREQERIPRATARFGAFLGLALGNVPRVHGDDTNTA